MQVYQTPETRGAALADPIGVEIGHHLQVSSEVRGMVAHYADTTADWVAMWTALRSLVVLILRLN